MQPWKRASFVAAVLVYSGADFEFRYSEELIVLQDFVYSEARVDGSKHVVVLRHKDAELGDLRSIEINMLPSLDRSPDCGRYTLCRVVDGVVIGTNSEDSDFAKTFETVADSFKRK